MSQEAPGARGGGACKRTCPCLLFVCIPPLIIGIPAHARPPAPIFVSVRTQRAASCGISVERRQYCALAPVPMRVCCHLQQPTVCHPSVASAQGPRHNLVFLPAQPAFSHPGIPSVPTRLWRQHLHRLPTRLLVAWQLNRHSQSQLHPLPRQLHDDGRHRSCKRSRLQR